MKLLYPFASQVNFLDPLTTSDGEPYGPWKYKEIVKECYIISKSINTSYTDLMDISPIERRYMIEFLLDENKRTKEALDKIEQERKSKKNN